MVLTENKRYIPKNNTTTTTTTTTTTNSKTNTDKIIITQDNGITKKIIKNGIGDNFPFDGDQIYVHIVGKTIDGTIFQNTRERSSYSFILGGSSNNSNGTGETIIGFNYAIKSMKRGEIATFTIKPKYAFGSIGNGNLVPPNATVIYEIELISFTNNSDISIEKDSSILKKIINNEQLANENDTTTTNQIIKTPRYESKVLIDYKIKLKESNELILEKKNYSFKIGEDPTILDILELIIETMQIGEHCVVDIEWLTFLKSMNQLPSDKLLPCFKELIKKQQQLEQSIGSSGNEKIQVEIRLIEFQIEKDKYQYQENEIIEIGLKKKEQGTELFKQKCYNMAKLKYKKAYEFFDFNFRNEQQQQADQKSKIKEYKISCLSNQTVCSLLMKQYKNVIELATQTLQLDENHIKSLNSRSKALRETGKTNLALYDIQKALRIDSTNKDSLNELSILNKLKEEELKKNKK